MAIVSVSFEYEDGFNTRSLSEKKGFTVGDLRRKFELPSNTVPQVNGVSVTDEHVLQDDEVVSFVQPQQNKAA